MNRKGEIKVGIPKGGRIFPGNILGGHDTINLNPLGNCPGNWILIGVIHTHPPDFDKTKQDPINSKYDPKNSNKPIGASPPVPWLVIDDQGHIYVGGPNQRKAPGGFFRPDPPTRPVLGGLLPE